MTGFAFQTTGHTSRISSSTFSETLHEHPLEMAYTSLDKTAHYKLKVVYAPEAKASMRLMANDKFEIHPMLAKSMTYDPVEFDIPAAATSTGELRLKWSRPPGLGGSGKGVQVAEVWLIRVHNIPTHERNQPYNH